MGRKNKKPKNKFQYRKLLIGATCIIIGLIAYWYFSLTAPFLPNPPLKALAAAQHIELGIHIESKKLNDKVYPDIVASQFDLTIIDGDGSHFKQIQPTRNAFDFDSTDRMLRFADQNNMPVQFHHLVWGDNYMLPNWLLNANFSKAEVLDILHNHINKIVGHYKGRVKEYSVVNEAFTENQHIYGLRNWFAEQLGDETGYIDKAFIWAHQADPKAKLILNDFYNETPNSVSDAIYNYVKAAKHRGVPIDGVGMQLHVNALYPPNKQQMIENMNRFANIGVSVYVTEFDINTNSVKVNNDHKLQLEASITKDVVGACIESKTCVSFDVFGLTSKNDLIKKITFTNSRAYMFDSRYRPRQQYYNFRSAWQQK